ncbi:glycosyltransferase family 4 protein [secondary endosymbiont of Ctenarytaina eucalypti]|uniref:Glycosyltransferase n=1 Tax=secondary endosymbiont of Ctenarytaina eucalypti TaxID=1199245 RepID=J3VS59_9ENTR|nr:glycosyltransferase family 4 protein [secondary endosymbiont of Ctenarytaina eucalypti]AFP84816.1 glycosyltransferase [secondary endosymbiont of Ctenarytaina eucalypti]
MKTIRLAIVRQKYRPDGGAERFISRALEALDPKVLALHIITRQWPGTSWPACHLHICNPRGNSRIARERGFSDAARRYWQQHHFDLVQSHERISGCDVFRAGDGAHRAWLEHRERIVPIHKRWLTHISPYHRSVLSAEREMFYSSQLKKIICNSTMVRDDIMCYYGVKEHKCALIYNAIDPTQFAPGNGAQRQVAREALSIPEKARALIFVGSGFARKGLRQALCAIVKTDLYLIVVGQDKHQWRYQALAKSLGCLSHVRFIGVCQDVIPYYHAADALILPTLYDPFPNAILEAMSCGLPVITSHHCGGAEFIKQGREGFICDALDIHSLRTFVAEIPRWEQDLAMSVAARQRVSRCTPENLSRQLMGLYRQLLS